MRILFVILISLVFTVKTASAQTQRPNIVVFIVDDMGWQDTSVPFWRDTTALNRIFHTPHMERMAAEGMKFTQAYASSVCSPTRVSLLTGMNPARHRVTNWTLRKNQTVDGKHATLDFPAWNVNGVQAEAGIENAVHATTLAMLLQQGGYHTIHVGKAHFGAMETPAADPTNLGFDINIAGHAAGGPGSFLGTENFGNYPDGSLREPWGVPGLEEFHGKDIFLTEALTLKAVESMDKAVEAQKPFFLYMSHYAVHVPFYADNRFYQKYIDAGLTKEEAQYASMVEGMDKSLGDIVGFLDSKGISDNTVILFLSDNGAYAISDRGRKGSTHKWNAPLKSGKGSAYEGGIRIPMIAKWPGKIAQETVSDVPVVIEDFYPTLLDLAAVTNRTTLQKIDGQPFTDLLRGAKRKDRKQPLIWHFPNNWGPAGPGIGATSTIRDGDWKLIYWHQDGKKELYNIARDIGEDNDLAAAEPRRVKKLSKKLGAYLRSVDAQMPIFKATGKTCPYPDEV